MAFTMGAWAKGHQAPFMIGAGGLQPNVPPTLAYHFELPDQTTTTAPVMQCPSGIAQVRMVIHQKSMTVGSGTVGPTYEVQVASDVGFTANLRTVTSFISRRVTGNQCGLVEGVVPDLQTNTFARVVVTLSGTDTVVFDALLDFLPGI
jgi:hypothetical protein